ncbi:MAG: hypothetical protein EOO85_16680 [Pedobacter sp.]|nr:MAG: hypothetical protein EOO85_16680 [Pedobacter sp.]
MNFLSHFYFDKDSEDDYLVLGIVLPDLIKNAQKDGNLYPLKSKELFQTDPRQDSILTGWERHILVDNIFHSSNFFTVQTGILKQLILPTLTNSPVKPFFLAHIGLELILDHLLTINNTVNINKFYDQLSKADKNVIQDFLTSSMLGDTDTFFRFFDNFISSKYLFSYAEIENITYALNRICMRLWNNPFNDQQLILLTEQLIVFKDILAVNYLEIFNDMEFNLNNKGL